VTPRFPSPQPSPEGEGAGSSARRGPPAFQVCEFLCGGIRNPEAWKAIAADRNAELRKVVAEVMEKTGLTKLADIAQALNLRGIKTNRGCGFTPTHIHRLLTAA